MKNLILTLGLLFPVAYTAQLVKLGAKIGVSYTNLVGANITGYDFSAVNNYQGGLVAEIKPIDNFGIQPELLYTTQGANYENTISEFTNKLGYISIPVMANIYMSDNLILQAGPQVSFLLSEKNDVDFHDSKTFDFSIGAGLQYLIMKKIFVQGRYNLGLTEAKTDSDVRNSAIQLSAGLFF